MTWIRVRGPLRDSSTSRCKATQFPLLGGSPDFLEALRGHISKEHHNPHRTIKNTLSTFTSPRSNSIAQICTRLLTSPPLPPSLPHSLTLSTRHVNLKLAVRRSFAQKQELTNQYLRPCRYIHIARGPQPREEKKKKKKKRMPALTRAELLAAARAFCDSFALKKSLDEILSHFASTSESGDDGEGGQGHGQGHGHGQVVVVHEHGLPRLAPFLGRDFRGLDGAREYFETVGRCLRYEDMRFVEFFVADAAGGRDGDGDEGKDGGDEGGKVAVRGKARFTWNETNQSWDETFVYVLRFDGGKKLVRYEIWADSGAAYLAKRGELAGEGEGE
ncbi:hypothetical protein F5B21DRAFT_522862 [Xylaria acuta]|nr:hypothetical protein F5B21DRAFT_522862 [Xylaria acuta]